MKLKNAAQKTGLCESLKTSRTNRIYRSRRKILKSASVTLKIVWLRATCFLTLFPPRETRSAVEVVPIFAPIIITHIAGKVMICDESAVSQSKIMALLDCSATVRRVPNKKNQRREMSL
jgi:hypothetical protein